MYLPQPWGLGRGAAPNSRAGQVLTGSREPVAFDSGASVILFSETEIIIYFCLKNHILLLNIESRCSP